MPERLQRADYRHPPGVLARAILGCVLVRINERGERLAGRIVETEAYGGVEDQAAHSRNGHRSARNETMYGPPGLAYVYFTYGMHHCMNVVCGEAGEPVAVLIRALEPIDGVERMFANRTVGKQHRRPLAERHLCSGPARLCEAFGLDLSFNGVDLTGDDRLWIEPRVKAPVRVVNTTRVGVERAGEWARKPWRWYDAESAHISRRADPATSDLPVKTRASRRKSGRGRGGP